MCIRIRFAPRDQLGDLYDDKRQLLTLPDDLSLTTLFTLRAARVLLAELGVEQDTFGARCWCGEEVVLLPAIPTQRRSDEVAHNAA
ncbi:hypothetical protein [Streptomyces griseoluteus]|uniref:hypothetical protein n=1 Tax=Streptomyces griseoluteus TaxID=29306 RepID=UPI0038089145